MPRELWSEPRHQCTTAFQYVLGQYLSPFYCTQQLASLSEAFSSQHEALCSYLDQSLNHQRLLSGFLSQQMMKQTSSSSKTSSPSKTCLEELQFQASWSQNLYNTPSW
ncbi:hypothetical protein Prudu_017281 [Prunus dulcis]|uniref:Uncharacterized protein n=1 Tax=Prunus dulcis TaxID=3755 RepID=A0A4Y1RNG5_PRUDU|nr:hypothetical protein Prudu_005654 [Prunus dulcis]BBH05790.1 hypothetical protein Prudu_017281 [Prunus dulcis]